MPLVDLGRDADGILKSTVATTSNWSRALPASTRTRAGARAASEEASATGDDRYVLRVPWVGCGDIYKADCGGCLQ